MEWLRTLQRRAAVWVVLFVVWTGVAGATVVETEQLTVSTITAVGDRLNEDLSLLSLTAGDAADVSVYTVQWRQDTSGWFPVWNLELASDLGVLPLAGLAMNTAAQTVVLAQDSPAANHTYVTDLSLDRQAGWLEIRVFDETADRLVFAGGFAVPAYEGPLHVARGQVRLVYLPVGTTWRPGILTDEGTFVSLSQFETRDAQAGIRLRTLGGGSGHYRITAQTAAGEVPVALLQAVGDETWVPLPLANLPFGSSVVRVDYVSDGGVQYSEEQTIHIGRLDVWVDPLTADRKQGSIASGATVYSSEPLPGDVAASVWVDVYELKWDANRRVFEDVFRERMILYEGALDLGAAEARISFDWPLPTTEANWKAVFGATFVPSSLTRVGNKERLFSTYESAAVAAGESYTIAVLPDTQYFAKAHPHIFTRMTDWLTAHARELGIAAVLHVGDITDNNSTTQWENAYTSMSLLHDVIPYVFAVGNHDLVGPGGPAMRDHSRVNTFFPVERARTYSRLAGTMMPDRMENHYALFSIAGDEYVVISMEFWPPDEVLVWAEGVAEEYPDHRLILLTHSFLNGAGRLSELNYVYPMTDDENTTVNPGRVLWERFVRRRPNAFMAIGGHHIPLAPVVPYRVSNNVAGKPVFQLMFNWQDQPNGGNGWLGLMTFHPDDTVDITVYSPYLGKHADMTDTRGFTSNLRLDVVKGTVQPLKSRQPALPAAGN